LGTKWSFPAATDDVGAVVQVYSEYAVEVEFVTASGRTQALVTPARATSGRWPMIWGKRISLCCPKITMRQTV